MGPEREEAFRGGSSSGRRERKSRRRKKERKEQAVRDRVLSESFLLHAFVIDGSSCLAFVLEF